MPPVTFQYKRADYSVAYIRPLDAEIDQSELSITQNHNMYMVYFTMT